MPLTIRIDVWEYRRIGVISIQSIHFTDTPLLRYANTLVKAKYHEPTQYL